MTALCSREVRATVPPAGTLPRSARLRASVALRVKTRRSGAAQPSSAAQASRASKRVRLASRARAWLARPGLEPPRTRHRVTASTTPGALGWLVAALSR